MYSAYAKKPNSKKESNKSTKRKKECENTSSVKSNFSNSSPPFVREVLKSKKTRHQKSKQTNSDSKQNLEIGINLRYCGRQIYQNHSDLIKSSPYTRSEPQSTKTASSTISGSQTSRVGKIAPWVKDVVNFSKYERSMGTCSNIFVRKNSLTNRKKKSKTKLPRNISHEQMEYAMLAKSWVASNKENLNVYPRQVNHMVYLQRSAPRRNIWKPNVLKTSKDPNYFDMENKKVENVLRAGDQIERKLTTKEETTMDNATTERDKTECATMEHTTIEQKLCEEKYPSSDMFEDCDSNLNASIETILSNENENKVTKTEDESLTKNVNNKNCHENRVRFDVPDSSLPKDIQGLINWHSPVNVKKLRRDNSDSKDLEYSPPHTENTCDWSFGDVEVLSVQDSQTTEYKTESCKSFYHDETDTTSQKSSKSKSIEFDKGKNVDESCTAKRTADRLFKSNHLLKGTSSCLSPVTSQHRISISCPEIIKQSTLPHPTPAKKVPQIKSPQIFSSKGSNTNLYIPYESDNILPGILAKHELPADDDSNLFNSINFLMLSGDCEGIGSGFLRNIVADEIASDPELYNSSVLGQSNSKYCEWIRQSFARGGIIELYVLSNYFCMEIDVVDTRCAMIRRFGDDRQYPLRVFLFYDGWNFEPLYLATGRDEAPITIFPVDENVVFNQAKRLIRAMRYSPSCSNLKVNSIPWRCMDCRMDLKGTVQVEQHVLMTGHYNFSII